MISLYIGKMYRLSTTYGCYNNRSIGPTLIRHMEMPAFAKASARQAWRRADDGYSAEKLAVLFREDRGDICYKFHRVRFAVG
jgi:hypothetical protein